MTESAAARETHLSESVAVSLGGHGDDDLLPPLWAQEELQVLLDGLQPGQFGGEVYGRDAGMVGVPVQLLLQRLVDLIQRAQQELQGSEQKVTRCS